MKKPLSELLLTSRAVRVAYFSKHIDKFASYYLNEHFRGGTSKLHRAWLEEANSGINIAKAAPRGHAKSTTFSLAYALHCILYEKKKFIVLISDTATQAETLLGTIIQELETNERILKDFGSIAGYVPKAQEDKEKWTAKEIVTLTGVKVIARGWKSKLRGLRYGAYRPDLILIDDWENDENVQSQDQRDKVKKVFNNSIMNLGDKTTQIIIVGTILHFDSLLQTLITNPLPGWSTMLHTAIEDNFPLWPEYWTIEELDNKRAQIGSIAFEQEYMNNPLDPGAQILVPSAWYESIDLNNCECYAYLDLSSKEKETSDYVAIVTVARERSTGLLYTVDPQRMRGSMEKVMEWFFNYVRKYNHKKIGIESNNFQIWFYQLVQKEGNTRGLYPPVVAIEQIKDKVTRAKSIAVYVENQTVRFNKSYQDFNAEVEQFPKATHDDWTDSLVEGIKLAVGMGYGAAPTSAKSELYKEKRSKSAGW